MSHKLQEGLTPKRNILDNFYFLSSENLSFEFLNWDKLIQRISYKKINNYILVHNKWYLLLD